MVGWYRRRGARVLVGSIERRVVHLRSHMLTPRPLATWQIQDPQNRRVALVEVEPGLFDLTVSPTWGAGDELTGSTAGVTLWQEVTDADGYEADPDRDWTDRMVVTEEGPCALGSRLGWHCGWLPGLPSDPATVVKLPGCKVDTAGRHTGSLLQTAGSAAPTYGQIQTPQTRRIDQSYSSQGQGLCMQNAKATTGADVLVGGLNTYFKTVSVVPAARVYRVIVITSFGTAPGPRTIRLRVRAGLADGSQPVVASGANCHASPAVVVAFLSDSLVTGAMAAPGGGNIANLLQPIECLSYRDWGFPVPAIQWVGTEEVSVTDGIHMPGGVASCNAKLGRTAGDLGAPGGSGVLLIAGICDALIVAGTIPDVFYVRLGINDMPMHTNAQILADMATICTTIRDRFPLCSIRVLTPYSCVGYGINPQILDYAAQLIGGALAGVADRIVDLTSMPTSGLYQSPSDWHLSMPAAPWVIGAYDLLVPMTGMGWIAREIAEDLFDADCPRRAGE